MYARVPKAASISDGLQLIVLMLWPATDQVALFWHLFALHCIGGHVLPLPLLHLATTFIRSSSCSLSSYRPRRFILDLSEGYLLDFSYDGPACDHSFLQYGWIELAVHFWCPIINCGVKTCSGTEGMRVSKRLCRPMY